jgi:hypothetical protein
MNIESFSSKLQLMTKGSPVHVAPACARSGEGYKRQISNNGLRNQIIEDPQSP